MAKTKKAKNVVYIVDTGEDNYFFESLNEIKEYGFNELFELEIYEAKKLGNYKIETESRLIKVKANKNVE